MFSKKKHNQDLAILLGEIRDLLARIPEESAEHQKIVNAIDRLEKAIASKSPKELQKNWDAFMQIILEVGKIGFEIIMDWVNHH